MKKTGYCLLLAFSPIILNAQDTGPDISGVGDEGLHRANNPGELRGFGINYTVPFAYGYRSAGQLRVDLKKAIDADVYHFSRLGFDAFRVHVWDTEISDSTGNLLDNEHLELFDYLLLKMKERHMRFLITPIAYWGNGWPEPDTKTPGFSYKYGKDKCLTDSNAIKAQQKYLFQFLNHVNRFTGIAYKNEPAIIAFEISNEPHHHGEPKQVTAFIRGMITSMRKTSCKKPIFYNISHSINLEQAYFDAGIEGGTFQWYPTGLGFKQELRGNMLPNVDDYAIPFANDERFKRIAKVVYEFDAADVGRSYLYPAMARSFRTAGVEWATQFAYDPTYTAFANTEYDTHFMNLVYAPQKALSLMIAGQVFKRIPLYKSYGRYPSDTIFDGCRLSYRDDLAELVTDEKFIYTNNTNTTPAGIRNLKLIAGFGNSPLVQYDGAGAYFLDRVAGDTWRLEVMPDAIWINDPFGKNSLKKTNVVIKWQENNMHLALSQPGNEFFIKPLNVGNTYSPSVKNGSFKIKPGTYLITNRPVSPNDIVYNNVNREFAAPSPSLKETYLINDAINQVNEGDSIQVKATVVSSAKILSVDIYVYAGFQLQQIKMTATDAYHYATSIPASFIKEGYVKYIITVNEADGVISFPEKINGKPVDWDFFGTQFYTISVVKSSSPIYLFNAFTDASSMNRSWIPGSGLVPASVPGIAELHVNIEKLLQPDTENPKGDSIYDYTMRYWFANKIAGRLKSVGSKHFLIFKGYALNKKSIPLQLGLIDNNGVSYGAIIAIDTINMEYRVAISAFKPINTVLLPRPYPSFLPYYFKHAAISFHPYSIESLQISIGPGLSPEQLNSANGIAIESVRLE